MPNASARFQVMLSGPILPMLARLSGPNIGTAFAFAAMSVADAWFIGQLGTVPLAAIALVFPVQTMMQMMSAGAMGGGVSSAVARALGAGDTERANALLRHGLVIALAMSAAYFVIFGLLAGPVFAALGGSGAVLDGAVSYAIIAFSGGITMWLANIFAAGIRASGNMNTPAFWLVMSGVLHIALCGALTLGWGPFPKLGIVGPAVSMAVCYGLVTVMLGATLLSGRSGVKLTLTGNLSRANFIDILKVGGPACGNSLLTIGTVLIVTKLVAEISVEALAGYGLGSRLELLIIPISFGIGSALTTSIGANYGAMQIDRARRIAWTGGLTVGGVTGLIGVVAAIWPALWLSHFTSDAGAYAFGVDYLRIAGPFYGFFGMGMALYFASQGTGNMFWPFTSGVIRLVVAGGIGAAAVLWFNAGPDTLFACVAAGLFCFGAVIAASLFGRIWRPA